MSFAHLHVHTEGSILQSSVKVDKLLAEAQANKMSAIAITDLGNMFLHIDFYFQAKKLGINPILGLEVFVAPESRLIKEKNKDGIPSRRLVLLAKNYQGYQNLCRISSIGYKEGFYYHPRVDYDILEKHKEHLIVLSGGLNGEIAWTFKNHGSEKARLKIDKLSSIYGENFYLEITRNQNPIEGLEGFLLESSKQYNISLVATNEVYYLKKEDHITQDVLVCIDKNHLLSNPDRYQLPSKNFYFKSVDEMKNLFKDLPEALSNTVHIANQCECNFDLKDENGNVKYYLPSFSTEHKSTLEEEISYLSEKGLEPYISDFSVEKKNIYKKRLCHELEIINNMGFNGYFLIVHDFIKWGKQEKIPIGPGRGSGAASLVAFALKIVDVDPLLYDLVFERFLNPERISMPDFDIDFCQEHRSKVIDYVTKKYGEKTVSQIITFGKLQTKAAIRDVGRVLGMSYNDVDAVVKLVPDKLGICIAEAISEEPRLSQAMEEDSGIKKLMDLAQKVEKLTRHASIHAAGVVIADRDMTDIAPLYRGGGDENVIQYEMNSLEKIGLIKFDFLGLKTLTHLQKSVQMIQKNKNKNFTLDDISIEDPKIYDLLAIGETDGIFQFSSSVMTDFLIKLKPKVFSDLVVATAINRPGPMEMVPLYLKRRFGKAKPSYLFKEIEPILSPTLGVIIYQEQVMKVASVISNYSMGEADILRKAMGKKIPGEMEKQKERFLKGAQDQGYDIKKSEKLFDQLAEFAKYGFPKAHGVAYSMISAQTAYLKAYYPVEFYAGIMSTEINDTDKLASYVRFLKKKKIEIISPHVNHSEMDFSVSENKINYPLLAIKGVGELAADSIITARNKIKNKKFDSLYDFFISVDLRKVNKKTIESLIKAGALDNFGYSREDLFKNFHLFVQQAEAVKRERAIGQMNLFSLSENESNLPHIMIERQVEWGKIKKLSFEKEVLGFFLTGSPLSGMDGLMRSICSYSLEKIQSEFGKSLSKDSSVTVYGVLSRYREVITKKGDRMAFGTLADLSHSIDMVIFPRLFSKVESLGLDIPLVVEAAVDQRGGRLQLVATKITLLEKFFRQAKSMTVFLNEKQIKIIAVLEKVLQEFNKKNKNDDQNDKVNILSDDSYSLPLNIQVNMKNKVVELATPLKLSAPPSLDLVAKVGEVLGNSESVFLRY